MTDLPNHDPSLPVGSGKPLTDDLPIVIHGPTHGSGVGAGLSSMVPGDERMAVAGHAAPPVLPPIASNEPRRAYSLDALRGFFLVMMTFGFTIQTALLPLWMYHKQMPPPTFALVDVPGIGWRDLAYAAFIFTMAAALPITLSRRIEAGETEVGIILAAVRRFLLLFVFALLIGHSNTYFVGYTQTGRALAVAGFIIMFAVFVRRKREWAPGTFVWLTRAGWVAAALFLLLSPLSYDSTFSPARRDEIIAYLAVASLVGSIVWYFTRDNILARLAVLAGIVALYLGARGEGWIGGWWWTSPAPWLFRPTDLALMSVVIPGTIAGDIILRFMRAPSESRASGSSLLSGWSPTRVFTLGVLGIAFMPLVVAGLYGRWVEPTTQLVLFMCAAGAIVVWNPRSETERALRSMFFWAALWLIVGLFLEPSEGGIKKVPETLSYFFTVTGLTMMALVTMMCLVDVLGRKQVVQTLIDVGHNPMLCYVLYTVFLNSILEMIPPMREVLRSSAGEVVLRSVISTIVVVLIVRAFTQKRIFWRT